MNIKLSEIVDVLTENLACSRRSLACMLNLDKNTITNNAEKTLDALSPNTFKKFIYLYYIVTNLLPAHKPDAIHKIIKAHVFKNYTGETDSVLSSIQQLKHDLDALINMAKIARKEYEEQLREKYPMDKDDWHDLLYA